MMEKISEGLTLARAEKEAVQETLRQVIAEAAALGEVFNGIRTALEASAEKEKLSCERLRKLEETEHKMRRSIEESMMELRSNKEKARAAKCLLEVTLKDLEVRKEELREVEELLRARRMKLVVKNEELDSVGGLIEVKYAELVEELQMKEAELEAVRESMSECTKFVELKRKELEQILEKIKEPGRVPEENEEWSNSTKSRDFHLQLQQFHQPTEGQNEDRTEGAGADPVNPGGIIKTEPLEIVPFVGSPSPTRSCRNLLCLEDNSSNSNAINLFFREAYQWGLDPAKVVLDMIRGSPDQLQSRWDAADISLLEQLTELSPPMTPEVTERAFQLATAWKMKLEDKPEGPWEVLGFLHFLAAYMLISSFDKSEIGRLAEAFSLTNSHPGLCQALGLTAENDCASTRLTLRPDRGRKHRPSPSTK